MLTRHSLWWSLLRLTYHARVTQSPSNYQLASGLQLSSCMRVTYMMVLLSKRRGGRLSYTPAAGLGGVGYWLTTARDSPPERTSGRGGRGTQYTHYITKSYQNKRNSELPRYTTRPHVSHRSRRPRRCPGVADSGASSDHRDNSSWDWRWRSGHSHHPLSDCLIRLTPRLAPTMECSSDAPTVELPPGAPTSNTRSVCEVQHHPLFGTGVRSRPAKDLGKGHRPPLWVHSS